MKTQSVRLQIFLMLFMLALAQLACKFGAPSSTTSPTLSPQNAPQNNPPASSSSLSGDPKTDVLNALHLLPTLSYRKTEWFVIDPTKSLDVTQPPTLTAEFTPPGNTHVTFADVEYIRVNGNFYSRKSGGAWELSAPDVGSNDASKISEDIVKQLEAGGLTVTAAGSDTIKGVAVQVYDASAQVDMSGTKVDITGKIWLGNDGRMVRMDLNFPGTQQAYDTSYYEYDPNIKIEAPIP